MFMISWNGFDADKLYLVHAYFMMELIKMALSIIKTIEMISVMLGWYPEYQQIENDYLWVAN